ncbi:MULTISPECIES: RsmF rRNA methyltransferase first C-terminal domain-containing protein [Faecalicoccus]|uniref:RsmF rRNA methyltransferase first C-terminal domain-containing protein n=1 Tax=Faecalicoccus pleomorphus TaxID=1323 RepID=A0AAW6CT94_9FIRM|nr:MULTISPECIES: RsmF rRNA methyltransferase first C-terminal domain-containing protein [Faecalicoccus]MDB7980217.1 RsmF rRNA methyltransferase first C-terminal domain-containing protein [Faecalicoccus pleomorphus]MDB7982551.1 RsmF rRNA methyltransferase first C-terminal domain-containing protein [Faecalicoccus pleomorphus]
MNDLFLERMKRDLKEDYPAFETSLEQPMYKGLSYHPKKITEEMLKANTPLLEPSPFYAYGYYIDRSLGNHPYHIAGAFYLQEPSASAAVTILDVQPSDTVLDLCAAPGGKSSQILSQLQDGFLVSNEYDGKRARILLSNLERMSAQNFCLIQGDTKVVCEELESCFDRVLVDAPCSGEGMMKKHDAAQDNWSLENIQQCAMRQAYILDQAYKALKKGGYMVYSTCTYAREENEETIAAFLKRHPDMQQVDPEVSFGQRGFDTPGMDADKVVRIFPMQKGEGHFICKMQKKQGDIKELPVKKIRKKDQDIDDLHKLLVKIPTYTIWQEDSLYMMDHPFIEFRKTHCLRQGILAGSRIKKRFEPAHAMFMAFPKENYKQSIELDLEQMDEVMHGLQIPYECKKGYTCYCIDGIPFGFGKSDGHRINNRIPKGLRLLPKSHVTKGDF